jgi:mediator of replication checkpoint protein 1
MDAADQRQRLSQLKKFWLLRQKESEEDGDLGLEVEKPTELERQRKSTGKKISQGQQILLANAGVRKKPLRLDPQKAGQENIAGIRKAILKQGTSDPHVLNLLLRRQAEEESLDIVKQKEEEWKRLGGTVRDRQHTESVEDAQRNQIQRGLAVWSGQATTSWSTNEDVDDAEEDGSDWSKESGSESGSEDAIDYEKMEMVEDDEEMVVEQGRTDNGSDVNQSEGEKEDPTFKGKSKGRSRRRVVDSDESDTGGEAVDNDRPSGTSAAHYITSSSDDRTEDENDKENNTRLMFDRSDDKENKAVVRHVPFPSTSSCSVFDDSDRDLSLSPPHVVACGLDPGIKSGPESPINASEEREPFGILSEASPMSHRIQSTGLTQSFDIQLEHSPSAVSFEDGDVFAPVLSAPVASLTFAPVFDCDSGGKGKEPALGFSQVLQESGTRSFGAPSLLRRPGLSDLFNSNTQKEVRNQFLSVLCCPSKISGYKKDAPRELRKQESLGLTQDLILQPALQVDEKILRKADTIFEKEQESVVEAMNKKDVKEQEVYVNDLG